MKQKDALKMRTILDALFSFSDDARYGVAIRERYDGNAGDDWEVHVFVKDSHKSGLLNLALLMHAIEMVSFDFLATESTFDTGTIKGENVVQTYKIW